jgi:hypothetical protein
MIDIKSLLPEVAKLLPGIPPQELIAGIQQFMKTHPNLNNQQAIQALMAYLEQQKQGVPQAPAAAPSGPPFSGLMNSLPTGVK